MEPATGIAVLSFEIKAAASNVTVDCEEIKLTLLQRCCNLKRSFGLLNKLAAVVHSTVGTVTLDKP